MNRRKAITEISEGKTEQRYVTFNSGGFYLHLGDLIKSLQSERVKSKTGEEIANVLKSWAAEEVLKKG